MKYVFKIINNEKLFTDEKNFNDWLYNVGDDYVICYGDSGVPLYVKKTKILFGFRLGEENE